MRKIKFDHNNIPNPSKFINSYRYLGYDNYSAIADLVDNSFDAKADNVWITINTYKNGHFVITIGDDGSGMNKEKLEQAFRLGSLTERDQDKDLGKYGVGSASASISIAKKTTVITKAEDSLMLIKAIDLEHMIETNSFDVYLDQANKEEEKTFKDMYSGSETGTLVMLEDCDNVQNSNVTQFKNQLRKHLGQVYRFFLDSGKKIYLNAELIKPIDPLLLTGFTYQNEKYETQLFSDDTYDIKITKDGKESIEKIRIRIALLPWVDKKLREQIWPKDVELPSYRSQGFYVIRNFREISAADTLGLGDTTYKKHPRFNRFRGELFFNGSMDQAMGVNFTKRRIELSQSVRDQLGTILKAQLETIDKILQRKDEEKNEDIQVSFRESEQIIISREKLLIRKQKTEEELKKEIEEQRKRQGKRSRSEIEDEKKRVLDDQGKPKPVHFDIIPLGRNGVFFEIDYLGGTTVVIKYNVDHPFYSKFYSEKDRSTQNDINLMLHSYALARRHLSDEQIGIVDQMEGLWSLNLKALLD